MPVPLVVDLGTRNFHGTRPIGLELLGIDFKVLRITTRGAKMGPAGLARGTSGV